MIIAFRTKDKGQGDKNLKDLVTKLELFNSDKTKGTVSIEIKEEQLSNALNGSGKCVEVRIQSGTATNWSSTVNSDFSRFISPKLGLKSVQCKSETFMRIKS